MASDSEVAAFVTDDSVLRRAIGRVLNTAVAVRHPRLPAHYRPYLAFQQVARLYQLRTLHRDYLLRHPYKVIDYDGEFGIELMAVLPFAYWHQRNGTLDRTISCKDTRDFYFFSPNHEERYAKRRWRKRPRADIPNHVNHVFRFNLRQWTPVPLKARYRNSQFVFDKPLLVIANKFNQEWNGPPVNYIDLPTLTRLFNRLGDRFQIIYNRPQPNEIVVDDSRSFPLGDFAMIDAHFPNVITMQELQRQHSSQTFNRLQLMVYANAEYFIAVQGGPSVLASYFGGDTLIYAKHGAELFFDEYRTIYPLLSGANVQHAATTESLLRCARRWVE